MTPKTLPAFTPEERKVAHHYLARRVAYMMGRKWEEGDWAEVYCKAKNIPPSTWSNLHIDVMHGSLGVEHKMYCFRSRTSLSEACGTTIMHPAATRAVRVESTEVDPNSAMRDVLLQYGELIKNRTEMVREQSGSSAEPDMRVGYLLWQESLREFLYFEEEMLAPNPDNYFAEWKESGGGRRRASKNLWVYEKDTGRKRFSVTTKAGVKIQPYFDVPPPSDPNVYLFTVIGEVLDNGFVRVWLSDSTARELRSVSSVEDLSADTLSEIVLSNVDRIKDREWEYDSDVEAVVPFLLSQEAYDQLTNQLEGVNDDHRFQMLIHFMRHVD